MSYGLFICYVGASCVLGVAVIVLQYQCMYANKGQFITSYCYYDSEMRAVIAAIVTLSVAIIGFALSDAILAFRTYALSRGINEGVFVALAIPSGIMYKTMAMFKTRWCFVVLMVLVLHVAPMSFQTLSNLAIKTAAVYVRNKSMATVYDAQSYYNATSSLGNTPPNYVNAINLLSSLKKFESSAVSLLINSKVQTNVVRDGFVGVTHVVDGDTTNAFKHNETVTKIATSCTPTLAINSLPNYVTNTSNILGPFQFENSCSVYIYDIQYAILSLNIITFHTVLSLGRVTNCTNSATNEYEFSVVTCDSTLIINKAEIVYTTSTGSISINHILSNVTTVDVTNFASLIINITTSIEQSVVLSSSFSSLASLYAEHAQLAQNISNTIDYELQTYENEEVLLYNATHNALFAQLYNGTFAAINGITVLGTVLANLSNDLVQFSNILNNLVYTQYDISVANTFGNFEQGLFNESTSNLAHTRIVTSVTLALNLLWNNYNGVGNNFTANDKELNLHNIVQLAFLKRVYAYVFAGLIVGITLILSIIGTLCTLLSPINIKPNNETAIIDNFNTDVISERSQLDMSNDPVAQRLYSFTKTLYAYTAESDKSSKVGITYTQYSKLPTPT